MKNIAIIFAGGTGQRMNTKAKPKQFLELHGKPILVYTLEQFQKSEDIDGIILVILKDWLDYSKDLTYEYHLTKVASIVPGGKTGQESIYNGLIEAERLYGQDVIVLIHDGVRPIIDSETIKKNIECVKEHGTSITVTPSIETVAMDAVDGKVGKIVDRSKCLMARAPQSFYLKDILGAHRKSISEEQSFIDSASMMLHYGYDLYTVIGPIKNIKITTPDDYYVFRALVDAKENDQLLS